MGSGNKTDLNNNIMHLKQQQFDYVIDRTCKPQNLPWTFGIRLAVSQWDRAWTKKIWYSRDLYLDMQIGSFRNYIILYILLRTCIVYVISRFSE